MREINELPAELLQGRLLASAEEEAGAISTRVARVAQLADRGEHMAAAREAAGLLEMRIHDIRLIGFYLFGLFLERGLPYLPALLARISDLVAEDLDALRPERRKLQVLSSATAWLFEHVSARLVFHAKQRDTTWEHWCGVSDGELVAAIAAGCTRASLALEAVVDAPLAAVPLARIRRWASEDLRRALGRREAAAAQATPAALDAAGPGGAAASSARGERTPEPSVAQREPAIASPPGALADEAHRERSASGVAARLDADRDEALDGDLASEPWAERPADRHDDLGADRRRRPGDALDGEPGDALDGEPGDALDGEPGDDLGGDLGNDLGDELGDDLLAERAFSRWPDEEPAASSRRPAPRRPAPSRALPRAEPGASARRRPPAGTQASEASRLSRRPRGTTAPRRELEHVPTDEEVLGAPVLRELQAKLQGFQHLVARGELAKAAVVAADVRAVLEEFDPVVFFPAMFSAYFRALHQIVDELMPYLDSADQPTWHALESYYRADPRGFFED